MAGIDLGQLEVCMAFFLFICQPGSRKYNGTLSYGRRIIMFDETRRIAGRGLMLVFTGQIVSFFSFIPFIGILALVAGALLSLYGFYTMSKTTAEYQNAFIFTLVGMAIGLFASFFSNGFMGTVFSILKDIVNFLVVYYVCSSTSHLLEGMGLGIAYAQADRGRTIWTLYAVCMGISIACRLLSYIPVVNILAALISIAGAVVQLVASILYLIFLWNSQRLLQS